MCSENKSVMLDVCEIYFRIQGCKLSVNALQMSFSYRARTMTYFNMRHNMSSFLLLVIRWCYFLFLPVFLKIPPPCGGIGWIVRTWRVFSNQTHGMRHGLQILVQEAGCYGSGLRMGKITPVTEWYRFVEAATWCTLSGVYFVDIQTVCDFPTRYFKS